MLRVNHLFFSRDHRNILSDISFEVQDGGLLLVSGPNGVGKSTLLRSIAGVDQPSHGESDQGIVITGEIADGSGLISALSLEERFRRGVMLTFQEPPVLPGVTFFTVAREMLFARTGARPDVSSLYRDIRALFARLRLSEEFIERSLFDGFSGGEKKRIELAFLLLARPRIALLDEIDAGLDAEGRLLAQEAIRELLADGSSVLCVTHNPDFLHEFSQKATLILS